MGDLQSQETSNPCSVSQWAALEAVTGPQDSVAAMKAEFEQRRDYVLERIDELPGRDLPAARRRILRVHEYLGALRSDARRQADHRFDRVLHGCPQRSSRGAGDGSAFGAEGYARLSFATDMRTLGHGFDALAEFLRG